jgi:DNA gyrase subunit B
LYKVKQGKQEQYLKDDDALFAYLTQTALDGASFYPAANAPAVTSQALEALVLKFRRLEHTLKRHARRYHADVLKHVVALPYLTTEQLKDHETVRDWGDKLCVRLQKLDTNTQKISVDVFHQPETMLYLPRVIMTQHGTEQAIAFNADFFASKDYKDMAHIASELMALVDVGAMVSRGEKKQAIDGFEQALQWFMDEAKRGQTIQRYKGLGEMNPDQLWETTMDPEVRRMLQVTVEDAVAADEVFTTLMGDQVEPRREFIEINALDAENIDI